MKEIETQTISEKEYRQDIGFDESEVISNSFKKNRDLLREFTKRVENIFGEPHPANIKISSQQFDKFLKLLVMPPGQREALNKLFSAGQGKVRFYFLNTTRKSYSFTLRMPYSEKIPLTKLGGLKNVSFSKTHGGMFDLNYREYQWDISRSVEGK